MKKTWTVITIGLVVALPTPASAHEYLTSVASEVYQTNGTQREIAVRAMTCMAQHLAAGGTDSQLIISSDLDGGTIVARNALQHGSFPVWQLRARFTLEARDGRFRIEQTNLERFNREWGPIGKWAGSGWRGVEQAFVASATAMAQCIQANPRRQDW